MLSAPVPQEKPFSDDPEADDLYRCHKCGNAQHFIGIDADGYGGDGSCDGSCPTTEDGRQCVCTTTLRQPFTVDVETGGIHYGLFTEGGSGAQISFYTSIVCAKCDEIIYQSPEHS